MAMNIPQAPLFRDPVYDGATDPTVIWNRVTKSWWILYTSRRPSAPGDGVAWVHGTDIGIAESKDGGRTWLYRGTVSGLDFEPGRNTFWAPEVVWHDGLYHMFVSYITGVPTTWQFPRTIIHYTSTDLWNWKYEKALNLSSERVIDACVFQYPDGMWRMWYKDENHNSQSYMAQSRDLYDWEPVGPAFDDVSHEGPNVFFWRGKYWLIADFWSGLMVQRSDDGLHWARQADILDRPGTRRDDGGLGHHADILVQGDNAYIFYFTHPGEGLPRGGEEMGYAHKRTSLQVAKLDTENGVLVCRRDEPFDFRLEDGTF